MLFKPLRPLLGGLLNQPTKRLSRNALAAQPKFRAKLKSTIVPTTGSGTPTYTRASTATVVDFEGVVRTVKSGEARMSGMRRVENLYANSTTLVTQGNTTVAGQYLVSFYGTGSVTLSGTATGTLAGTGASNRVYLLVTTTAGTLTSTVTGSCTSAQLENVTGQSVQTPGEYVPTGTGGPMYGAEIAPQTSSFTSAAGFSITNGTLSIVGGNLVITSTATGNSVLSFGGAAVNGTTYTQTTSLLNPAAYVHSWYVGGAAGTQGSNATSETVTNTAAANSTQVIFQLLVAFTGAGQTFTVTAVSSKLGLFSGAGVDGVQYFSTTLGGSAITGAGYLNEPSRTNLLLWSRDLSNAAWSSTGGTTVALNAVGIDGAASSASTVTATATSHIRAEPFTCTASTQYTFSFYAKRGTMTDLKYSVQDLTGAVNIIAPTSYYSQTNSSSFVRVTVTFTTPVGCVLCVVSVIRDSGVTGTVIIDGCQVELGVSASTVLLTTTAAVTRAADSLTTPVVASVTQGTWVVSLVASGADTSVRYPGVMLCDGTGNNKFGIYVSPGMGVMNINTGSNSVSGLDNTILGSPVAGTKYTVVVSWNSGAVGVWVNGGSKNAFTGVTMPLALNSLKSTLNQEWLGNITNQRVYSQALSDATCLALSNT